jgi:hypothetical protein
MRTELAFIKQRMGQALAEGPSTPVTIRWSEVAGGVMDPTTKSIVGGVVTAKNAVANAFVHFVQPGGLAVREFQEVETGDAVLEFMPDVALEGAAMRDVTFEFNGAKWETKPVSERLAQSWDVFVRGERLYRTVLVRKTG